MVQNVLIRRTGLNERGGAIGGQNVVPQMGELVRNVEAQQALANDADVVQTGHHLAVVLGHGVAEQVGLAAFGE